MFCLNIWKIYRLYDFMGEMAETFANLLLSEKTSNSENMDELYLILKHLTWIF